MRWVLWKGHRSLAREVTVPRIHYFHIDHHAPCLPPKFLYDHCFQFVLGITVVPREIKDNGNAKFWGVNKVHYGLCENGECDNKQTKKWSKFARNHCNLQLYRWNQLSDPSMTDFFKNIDLRVQSVKLTLNLNPLLFPNTFSLTLSCS